MSDEDLLGIYFTDGEMWIGTARQKHAVFCNNTAEVNIVDMAISKRIITKRTDDERVDIEQVLNEVIAASFKKLPNLRSIGVGCYGHFTKSGPVTDPIEKFKWGKHLISYGVQGTTTRKRELSNVNFLHIISRCVEKYAPPRAIGQISICIETDVVVELMGFIRKTKHPINKSEVQHRIQNTTGIIKASRGIGGTFMHSNDVCAWHGAHHTEMGKIRVQPWEGEQELLKTRKLFTEHSNPFSVEGYASIPAIEYYYNASFDTLKKFPEEAVWEREAWYLAQFAWNFMCFVSPNNILLLGKIMSVPGLLEKIRKAFNEIGKSSQYWPACKKLHDKNYLHDGQHLTDKNLDLQTCGIEGALCLAALARQSLTIQKIET